MFVRSKYLCLVMECVQHCGVNIEITCPCPEASCVLQAFGLNRNGIASVRKARKRHLTADWCGTLYWGIAMEMLDWMRAWPVTCNHPQGAQLFEGYCILSFFFWINVHEDLCSSAWTHMWKYEGPAQRFGERRQREGQWTDAIVCTSSCLPFFFSFSFFFFIYSFLYFSFLFLSFVLSFLLSFCLSFPLSLALPAVSRGFWLLTVVWVAESSERLQSDEIAWASQIATSRLYEALTTWSTPITASH